VGKRDQQWQPYLWCTDPSGHTGWVPESYLKMTGEREAVALRSYDATELTIGRGEELEVLDEAGAHVPRAPGRTHRTYRRRLPADHPYRHLSSSVGRRRAA
jgi:hypothetical protein